ncbi:unnamed protein product [Linum tenue]|nr:unnamed protein product [Linum tenue]
MTYISYSNICANIVRNCLKEPHKSDALAREKVHFTVTKWSEGKPEKPSKIPALNPHMIGFYVFHVMYSIAHSPRSGGCFLRR